MDKLKPVWASAYSAVITIIVVVVMTIGAELSMPFKNWLTGFSGHHWVTKSWISILVFVLFFCVFRFTGKSVDESQTRKALVALQVVAVFGFLAILGFYVYEFFGR